MLQKSRGWWPSLMSPQVTLNVLRFPAAHTGCCHTLDVYTYLTLLAIPCTWKTWGLDDTRFWRACIGTGMQGSVAASLALVLCHSSRHKWSCFAVCQHNPASFLTLTCFPTLGSQVGCENKHSLEMSILVFITEHLWNNTCIQCQPFHIPPFCSRGVLPYKSTSESAEKPSVGEEQDLCKCIQWVKLFVLW